MSAENLTTIPWACHSEPVGNAIKDHLFSLKDSRYDPLVGVALCALRNILSKNGKLSASTAVIALTDSGCRSHVKRVTDGIIESRPRQAFFARGGANMLASYASIALESHGPCFSMSGGADALRFALDVSLQMIRSNTCEQILLIAADYEQTDMHAIVLLLDGSNQEYLEKLRVQNDSGTANPSSILRNLMKFNIDTVK